MRNHWWLSLFMAEITSLFKKKKNPPQESTLVNLANKIPEKKRKEIATQICTDYDNDIQSRSQWEENRNKWYKLWACIRDKKTDPWEGCSNVCIPLLASASNQFHARAYQSIFAPPGMVKAIPMEKNDIKRAENVEKYMNWQTLYEMEEYEEVFDRLLQLLPINGTAFKKLYYNATLDRNVSEYISALDIVLPYRTRSLESARRIVHRLWLHYDELKERDEQKLYIDFDKVSKTASKEDDSALNFTKDETTGEDNLANSDKPHLILECHKDYDIGDKRKPYVFTVDYDSKTLLRVSSREFKRGSVIKKLNYFIDYHFIPNPEGFYSLGFGHFLEPLNEMANSAFNLIFDSGSLTNTPFGFYGRRAGFKKQKIKLKPGGMYEIEDANQVQFPIMQRVDQILFQVIGLTQQYIEQFTSTSDYLSGRESRGTKTPTAHGTLAIIEQGLVTFAVMTKRIFRSLRKELRLLMALNQIHLPDSKEYRIMGTKDNFAFPDVKRDDFGGVYDIIPIGDPSYASKLTRRQEAKEIYGILMSSPLVTGTPPDEEGNQLIKPDLAVMHEALSNVLDGYDLKNKDKLLPPKEEESIRPEDENAMFMQGDYKEPVSGEDHANHLTVHTEFMDTPFYEAMIPEYKPLILRHITETQVIAYQDMTKQLQLGGGQQAVPNDQLTPQPEPLAGGGQLGNVQGLEGI